MRSRFFVFFVYTVVFVAAACGSAAGAEKLSGTLVVAVPVSSGVVVCADKRVYNREAGTYVDDYVKIRRISDTALFAATNTIGFYDAKAKRVAFDAFDITEAYTAKNNFADTPKFWAGLKAEITRSLRAYLAARKFAEWPESDRANNNLLFNLVFYSLAGDRVIGHTLKVYYEKARTPVVHVSNPLREIVRTPKLSGKGIELINYLARNPKLASDPAIQRFDQTRFDAARTTPDEAVDFARKLFQITNTHIPKAQVSSAFDCASLTFASAFQWMR